MAYVGCRICVSMLWTTSVLLRIMAMSHTSPPSFWSRATQPSTRLFMFSWARSSEVRLNIYCAVVKSAATESNHPVAQVLTKTPLSQPPLQRKQLVHRRIRWNCKAAKQMPVTESFHHYHTTLLSYQFYHLSIKEKQCIHRGEGKRGGGGWRVGTYTNHADFFIKPTC